MELTGCILQGSRPPDESEYSKTCPKRPLKMKTKIGFQDQLSLNAGQKYCRMLQREHSAILSTYIKLPFVIKIFVLSIFEWPLKTSLTVIENCFLYFSTKTYVVCTLKTVLMRQFF